MTPPRRLELVDAAVPRLDPAGHDRGRPGRTGRGADERLIGVRVLTTNLVVTKFTCHDRRYLPHPLHCRRTPRGDRRRRDGGVRGPRPGGASIEAVAKRAGVSQPYVFQLFGTKKELFLAVVRRRLRPDAASPSRMPPASRSGARSPAATRVLDAMGRALPRSSSPTGPCSSSSSRPTPPARIRTSRRSSARSSARLHRLVAEALGRHRPRRSTTSSPRGCCSTSRAAVELRGRPDELDARRRSGGAHLTDRSASRPLFSSA